MHGICKGIWLKGLLHELKVELGGLDDMRCDSQLVMAIAKNLVHHDRTKYVEIDRHFIYEKIEVKVISLKLCFNTTSNKGHLNKGSPSS